MPNLLKWNYLFSRGGRTGNGLNLKAESKLFENFQKCAQIRRRFS